LKVKICGITNIEDLEAAKESGADLLGFNFVAGPRKLEMAAGRDLLRHVPATVTPVALVKIIEGRIAGDVTVLLGEFGVTHVQLYGQVDQDVVEGLLAQGLDPIQVIRVADGAFASQSGPVRSKAMILDAYDPRQVGGTGRTFCWEWVAQARERGELADWPPIFLAGGLNPDNVAEAIRAVRPFGVDVSSGVEVPGTPGKKDPVRMRAFVQRARQAAST
jgi:phosphoribosylanthranilate isomerase